MYSLLLALIYLAFISLGLPDALLARPGLPCTPCWKYCFFCRHNIYDYCRGYHCLEFKYKRVVRKFGTGLVTAVSVLMTAVALFGFSVSKTFWMLCLWSIPYGLGAGAVDSALNNFVDFIMLQAHELAALFLGYRCVCWTLYHELLSDS